MAKETNVKLVTVSVFVVAFMTAIEGIIVSTAMPTIVGSLHGTEIMNWVFSTHLLANAMLAPIYGKPADKIGRKPVFMIGIIISILGSSLCGFAQNMLTSIIARAIQGVEAGAILPVALTIIADMYPLDKRAKILGLNSAAWGTASIFNPLAGGFIVDTVGWHWIFFINVPIGLVLLGLISILLVEPKRGRTKMPTDILGNVTLIAVLLTLLLGFQVINDNGFTLVTFGCLSLSVLFFIAFVMVEKRAQDPAIGLHSSNQPTFALVNLIATPISGFLIGIDVYIPVWMQGVLGKSAGVGGLVLAPTSLLWMAGSFIASSLMKEYAMKKVLTIGLSILLVGAIFLVVMPMTVPLWLFFVVPSVLGIGFGTIITTTTVIAQSTVEPKKMGVATSFNTLVCTIGQTMVVSIFGVILNAGMFAKLKASALNIDANIMNQSANLHTANLIPTALLKPLHGILYAGLHNVYLVGTGLVVATLLLNIFAKAQRAKV